MPIPCTSPVHVRAATTSDLAAIARIHMASWHDAYRGVIPDEILDGRTVEGSLSGWRSTLKKYPDNISVAETGDALLAGFCCAGPVVDAERNAPFEFEIYGLHVAPIMRRRGIGAALLRAALNRAVVREQVNSAIVWTLKDLTLSRSFYAREGGELVKAGTWRVAQLELPEVAYGWRHLGVTS
jgi:ribosomal protein S18 acetylase RimI-like enzyme